MTTVVLNTPGSGTWAVPPGVTSVQAEVWGGGASGYPRDDVNAGGAGGGGGAYGRKSFSVSP